MEISKEQAIYIATRIVENSEYLKDSDKKRLLAVLGSKNRSGGKGGDLTSFRYCLNTTPILADFEIDDNGKYIEIKKHFTKGYQDSLIKLLRTDLRPDTKVNKFTPPAIELLTKVICPGENLVEYIDNELSLKILNTKWLCYYKSKANKRECIVVSRLTFFSNRKIELIAGDTHETYTGKFTNENESDGLVIFHLTEENGAQSTLYFDLQFKSGEISDILLGQYIRKSDTYLSSASIVIIKSEDNKRGGYFWTTPNWELPAEKKEKSNNIDNGLITEPNRTEIKIAQYITGDVTQHHQRTLSVKINSIASFQNAVEDRLKRWRKNDRRHYDIFTSRPFGKNPPKTEALELESKRLIEFCNKYIRLYAEKNIQENYTFSHPFDRIQSDYHGKMDRYNEENRINPFITIQRISQSNFFILYVPPGESLNNSTAIMEAAWAIQYRIPSLYIIEKKEDLPRFMQRLGKYNVYIATSTVILATPKKSVVKKLWSEFKSSPFNIKLEKYFYEE